MSTTNLLRIGFYKQRPKYRPQLARDFVQNRLRTGIMKKAIYNHAPKALADQAINGYRRSTGGDEKAEEDFLRTDVPYHDLKRDYHYRRALRVCEKLFRPSRTLHPISFPDLRFYPWNLSVSAEAPFTIQKKWETKLRQRQAEGEDLDGKLTFHNLYNEIFGLNRHLVHQIKEGGAGFWNKDGTPKPYWHTSLHTRAHLVKADAEDKLRAVFGVPKLLLQVENMFIWNIQKEYLNQKVKSPMLWGFETFRGGWHKLWNRLSSVSDGTRLSADWSGFDRFALFEVIDDVHIMWRNWFDFSKYEPTDSIMKEQDARLSYPSSKANPVKIQRLWDWMTYSIKHTPIRGFSGQLYQWQYNGIASGYQQTQLLDSFVNIIMLMTVLSASGINIESDNFAVLVQGDDSLSAFPETITDHKKFLDLLAKEAKIRFNATLSVDKTTIGYSLNSVEVLSYRNNNGIANRDEADLLAHLLYPERNQGLPEAASSCIGIAYASMGCSRTVYNVCRDAFEFLTTQFKVKPSTKWLEDFFKVRGLEASRIIGKAQFPSFEECYSQNYDYSSRTEEEKNRTWPSKPIGKYGFYFLND
nr:RNA-dependent RNA polymerase [Sarcosphaera coronaria partitivirus]